MTNGDGTDARAPLAVRRTIIVVVASVAVSAEVSTLLAAFWPVDLVAGYVAAVATVAIALRGRDRARRFTEVYGAVLVVALAVTWVARLVLGALPLSAANAAYPVIIGWLFAAPLLWTVPAATVGLFRWRWATVTLASALVVALVAGGALATTARGGEEALAVGYSGPVLTPSDSPESPLDGYVLRQVDLPAPGQDYPGAARIILIYVHPSDRADSLRLKYYSIRFTEGTDAMPCGKYGSCVTVGTLFGSPIVTQDAGNLRYVAIDGGVIEVDGFLNDAEAVKVLHDLSRPPLTHLSQLKIAPRFAAER